MPSLTVLLPAYNEAAGLEGTYQAVTQALVIAGVTDYEVLIITDTQPDGQHDGTPAVAIQIAQNDPLVRHLHKPFFMGVGLKYREGIHAATKEYIIWLPAHNLTEESSLINILLHVGQTPAIFTYTGNMDARPPAARLVSRGYVTLCNLLLGLDQRYYNGISVVQRELLQKIPLVSNDHVCLAEVIAYIVKSAVPYLELPQLLKPSERTGRAWNPENMFRVLGSLGSLFWRISIEGQRLNGLPAAPASPPALTLPSASGALDLQAAYQFASRTALYTGHQLLVYLVKAAIQALGLSGPIEGQSSSENWNLETLMRISRTMTVLLGKIALHLVAVSATPSPVTKRRRRRKKSEVSLTILMPAYREADHLEAAYQSVGRALAKAEIADYEILFLTVIPPDGGPDDTPAVAAQISQNDPRVRLLHSQQFHGLGYKYREGIRAASKNYVVLLPGDGEFDEDSVSKLLAQTGKAELIIPFIANPEVRPQERQIISRGFTTLCNILFGLNLQYYNGPCIIPRAYLQAVPMACDNFAYMAEILIYLVKSGVQYRELSWQIKPPQNSKAFRAESISETLETLMVLFWKVNVDGIRVNLPTNW